MGLKDIIKDESQIVAIRIAVPPVEGENLSLVTAAITEAGHEISNQTAMISCTDDKELYNLEVDPSPRVLLSSTEATVLLRKGLEGDSEATKMAETILKNLDDQETTELMNDNAHATLINAQNIIGDIKPGMSVSEQKRVLHETTVIGNSTVKANSNLICQKCNAELRAASKVCGNCGTLVNSLEGND